MNTAKVFWQCNYRVPQWYNALCEKMLTHIHAAMILGQLVTDCVSVKKSAATK
jgi:hypothetical protein